MIIALTNVFNLAIDTEYSCSFNKLQTVQVKSFWNIIKNSYYIYLYIAFILNILILITIPNTSNIDTGSVQNAGMT